MNANLLFLWLSKTDPKLYNMVPTTAQWTRIGLGLFVLITGLFAFVTSYYFISTLFSTYNEQTHTMEISSVGRLISFIGSLIWSLMIILIDREIVSASSRYSALFRLPLAIFLGFVIAIPFKMMFFSDRINKELLMQSRIENTVYEERMYAAINGIDEKIREISNQRNEAESKRLEWAANREAEITGRMKEGRTGIAGCGPACQEATRMEELYSEISNQLRSELEDLRESRDIVISQAKENFNDNRINQSYDFISQFEHLQMLLEQDNRLKRLALFLTIIFILIEVTPALMKLLKSKDEYDISLEVQQNVNSQIIIAYGNMGIQEIASSDHATLSKSDFPYSWREISDQLSKKLNA